MMIITNYSGILLFLVIAIILAVIVFAIPYLLSYKTIDREKFSSYECGFNPFKDSRNEFEIKIGSFEGAINPKTKSFTMLFGHLRPLHIFGGPF